jgi:CheY-like chemotaxis protein
MFTILIADDNIVFAKMLVNTIIGTMDNLRVVKIATDGKEALELMNSQIIDVVLIDLKMPVYNGNQVLSMLSEEKKKIYENSIIVITGEPSLIPEIIDNPMIFSIVSKGAGQTEKIIMYIKKLIESKSNDLKYRQIISELQKIGYNINLIGTQYLAQAIYEIHLRENTYQGNLKKEIYPILSRIFQKSVHNIKCNITRATENMNLYCAKDTLDNYFYNIQPTTKLVINLVLNKIA